MSATRTRTAPPSPGTAHLGALALIRPSLSARLTARLVLLATLAVPFVLWFVPWQQNVSANGRIIAFDPAQRLQDVEAPIEGRIVRWYVKEGQRVRGPEYSDDGKLIRPGDVLVSLQDPDPDLPSRLAQQRAAIHGRQQAARDRIISYDQQIEALKQSRDRALKGGGNRLSMAAERLTAAKESERVASLQRDLAATNYQMESRLIDDGLTSKLAFLTAQQRRDQTIADEKRAIASRKAAEKEIDALEADQEKIRTDADASISSAKATRQAAEAELASATRDLAEAETRIARQLTQDVTAPCDGVVFRVIANSATGGSLVKSGERLMTLTPDVKDDQDRVVELFLDGNDAPQLTELWRRRLKDDSEAQIRVRLQFEGWPAIQLIGWPTIAWGTFSGRVILVDPHDDGKGRFRVLVRQDPESEPWPDAFSLRQGARVEGWVLLDRVSLGYELWRRFNGFPPVVADKDKDKDDEAKKKPGKVKVPK